MSLFTFLFSHKNTTCIRQAQGESLAEAVENWLPMLESVQFGKDEAKVSLNVEAIREELKEARLVPLRNLHNVWSTFLLFDGVNAIVAVILTEGESIDNYALT